MSVQVHIPSALQALYHTQRIEEIEAGTIADLAVELNERYPGIHDRLMEPDGSLRRYVNVFVEQDDGRWPGEADTQLENGRKVWIVPNIAGGASPDVMRLEMQHVIMQRSEVQALDMRRPLTICAEPLPRKSRQFLNFAPLLDLPMREPGHPE